MPLVVRVALVLLLLVAPARAALDPALRCTLAKLHAASVRARALVGCEATGAAPGCVAAAGQRFARAFAGAESGGSCPTSGDAAAIAALVDGFVTGAGTDVADDGPCAGTALAAVGRYAAARLNAYRSYKRSHGNAAALVSGQRRAAAGLVAYLGRRQCGSVATDDVAAAADALARDVAGALVCGDGVRDPGEVCDGADAAACPGRCQADCRCPSASPFACLAGQGPLVTLDGTRAGPYEDFDLVRATRIDARTATFLASLASLYPINVRGGAGPCIAGARIAGQYDRSLTWAAMHEMNNAGVRFENDGAVVDGVRIDDVEDGIRPVGADFVVRGAWLSYVRDDCIENDHLAGGLIEDSLLDGCYVGVSERPSPAIAAGGADGRRDVLTISDTLVRLEPMPGPDGGAAAVLGHGQFFKWDDLASALALHDDVFLAEQVGQGGPDTMGVPPALVSCANNVMVWLGPGEYPAPLPSCFTVTTDRGVWDAAVAAWHARHPEMGP